METPSPTSATALPRYTARDATLTRFDSDGTATLHATASSVEYFDDDSGKAHDVQADLLADGDMSWTRSSPIATLPAHERRILLDGPVIAKGHWPDNDAPLTIATNKVWVDPETHQFETREAAQLNSEARYGSATGLRANWDERRLQLLHNVKMTYVAP